MKPTHLFQEFFNSEKAGGIVLLIATIISLLLANSSFQVPYIDFWKTGIAGHSLDHWINDGLMAIFFLLIGLELEREVYVGELSNYKNAILPVFAALGGMLLPAGFHLLFNYGTPTQSGAGIPMATDIAFALGMLSLLGNKVPTSLKIFLTALAVIDDLGAILAIGVLYSKGISLFHLGMALAVFFTLGLLNRLKFYNLIPYIIGGIVMWYFMLHSGIHATISGVMLAFVIPFGNGKENSPSYMAQHFLHKPVSFIILPVFALANTAIFFKVPVSEIFSTSNSIGIFLGLFVGKPVGIFLFSFLAVTLGICKKPDDLKWPHIFGLGLLGGIGFTMSIFIALLAFNESSIIDASKVTIMITSALSAISGLILLNMTIPRKGHVKK